MRGKRVRADQIKHALQQKHKNDAFFTEVKNGPTHNTQELLIIDALAIRKSWANPCITGYEIKTSRSDFLGDQKWPGYLPYCNEFSFVCPHGLIKAGELPDEIGLVLYNKETGRLRASRRPTYKQIDPPIEMLMYLIMRWDNQPYPFFSSKRDFFESWLDNKKYNKILGKTISGELGQYIQDLAEKLEEAEIKLKLDRRGQCYDEIKKAVEEFSGRDMWDRDVVRTVKSVLSDGLPPAIEFSIDQLERTLKKLKNYKGVSE